jgi:hypothetical protein
VDATGNISYGYFAGGQAPSLPNNGYSFVDRIDYSNDTATATPKGPLGGNTNSSYNGFGFSAAANAMPQ